MDRGAWWAISEGWGPGLQGWGPPKKRKRELCLSAHKPGGHGWRAAACEPGRGLRGSQPPAPPASRAGRTPHLCLSRPAMCCHDSLSGWRPAESRDRAVSLQPTRSASECLPFTSSRSRPRGFKDTPRGRERQPAGQGTYPAMARPAAARGRPEGPPPTTGAWEP